MKLFCRNKTIQLSAALGLSGYQAPYSILPCRVRLQGNFKKLEVPKIYRCASTKAVFWVKLCIPSGSVFNPPPVIILVSERYDSVLNRSVSQETRYHGQYEVPMLATPGQSLFVFMESVSCMTQPHLKFVTIPLREIQTDSY